MSNTRSEEFRVTNDNPTTCIRDKKDNTSVYLNLTTANFSGKIQVAIFGLCGDKKLNCTNKGLCFEVEAGKKYMLYNRVQEDHFPSAQLVFANLNGQTVEGTWSPDSKSESGCIELTDGLGLNSKNSDIVFQGPGTYCTEVRRKTSKSSVYFNLVDSKFSGTIDVSIYGISNDQEENCTNRRQSFSLSAGKKYELYNNVCEKIMEDVI